MVMWFCNLFNVALRGRPTRTLRLGDFYHEPTKKLLSIDFIVIKINYHCKTYSLHTTESRT